MLSILAIFCAFRCALAAHTEDWKSRSIYQVFTDRFARTDGSTTAKCNTTAEKLCGGTWKGITNHLDYIQGMGFDAIMISPVTKNIKGSGKYGEAYHGYWQQDLYELNDNFGTRSDLLDLGKALHSRKMYLMIDIVINNMAYMTNGKNPANNVDYSIFSPFDDEKYYHKFCNITDYDDYEIAQKCWTGDYNVALPDLKTEDKDVTKTMQNWVKGLVSNYSADGFRIDAAKHVDTKYLTNIAKAADIFVTGEVFERDFEKACGYQEYIPSVPNYPVYFSMIEAFTQGNTTALATAISKAKQTCHDVSALATFSENHDLTRFPYYKSDISVSRVSHPLVCLKF